MEKTLDYVIVGMGCLLGVLLIAMAVDTARRMHLDAPQDEGETPDAG